jgi:hypothetical protein
MGEKALTAVIQEAYVQGISTRSVLQIGGFAPGSGCGLVGSGGRLGGAAAL